MNLDQLSLNIRPRDPWPATDLGIRLGLQHFGALWAIWWLFALPIIVLTWPYTTAKPNSFRLIVMVWWLKPMMEIAMLVFLSHRIFQSSITIKDIVLTTLSPRSGLFGALTIRRFSEKRSALLAVALLERQPLAQAIKRRRQLAKPMKSAPARLTLAMHLLEQILLISVIVFGFSIIPKESTQSLMEWLRSDSSVLYLQGLLVVIYSLIAPFYLASGFSLYLNSRAQLEGWDLEIQFRRLKTRLQSLQPSTLLVIFMVVISLSSLGVNDAMANTVESTPAQAHAQIKAIIESEPYATKHVTKQRVKDNDENQEEKARNDRQNNKKDTRDFDDVFLWLSRALEGIAWAFVILGTAAFIVHGYRHRRAIANWLRAKQKPRTQHSVQSSHHQPKPPIHAKQLLQDAHTAYQQGQHRLAMSYLLAALLQGLEQKKVAVGPDSTALTLHTSLKSSQALLSDYACTILSHWDDLAWMPDTNSADWPIAQWIELWSQHFSAKSVVTNQSLGRSSS